MNTTDARPVRASWRDRDAAHEVPLGHLHGLLAADPPLGWAILRGLRDWEQGGGGCLEVWVGAGRCRVGEWARLGQMGYTGAEDEGMWAAMVGGDWEGEEAVKEDPPPPQAKPPPPKPQSPKLVTRKPPNGILILMTHRMDPPPPHQEAGPPPQDPPTKATPAPKNPPPPPQREGDGANHPLAGTKVHGPYPTGVEVGTITGVHRRKAGVVCAEYPDDPTMYEVAHGLLFPTPEAAQEHLERVRKGKGKATPPPPPKPSGQPDPKTNPLTNPKSTPPTNPTTNPPSNPKAQNNPTPNLTPDPTQQLWDPETGSQEV